MDRKRCVFHSERADKDPEHRIESALVDMAKSSEFECQAWVFPREVDLNNRSFNKARFGNCVFSHRVHLAGTSFIGSADFYGSKFHHRLDFGGATFHSTAIFGEAKFCERAEFGGTNFSVGARFSDASFCGEARFVGAGFSGRAAFQSATFAGVTDFALATFRQPPGFDRTTFKAKSGFSEVVFPEHTILNSTDFGPNCDLANADLKSITFRRCKMPGVALEEAYSASNAEYDYCEWGAPPTLIVTERTAHESGRLEDYRSAERVYREVRRSLEDHKDFQESHRFAYRELEMRRLARSAKDAGRWGWWRANLVSLEAWYRILSDYGESWRRPLFWLALLLLCGASSFAAIGIKLPSGNYDWGSTWGSQSAEFLVPLVIYSVRAAALISDPPEVRLELFAQLVQLILRIAAPFLAFLFGLTVRRRFRR